MKHEPMTQHSRKPGPRGAPKARGDTAFDLWLQRGLHKLFDEVAREPIPEELLRLIEDDRKKRGGPDGDQSSG